MSTAQQLANLQLQYSVSRVVVVPLQPPAHDTVPIQDNVFCSPLRAPLVLPQHLFLLTSLSFQREKIPALSHQCDARPPTAKGVDHRRIINWTSRSVTCHETGR